MYILCVIHYVQVHWWLVEVQCSYNSHAPALNASYFMVCTTAVSSVPTVCIWTHATRTCCDTGMGNLQARITLLRNVTGELEDRELVVIL